MYLLAEVKDKAKRKNDVANRRLHPLAARISIYFSWVFINLGLTPNQVTGIFFLTGLLGVICFYFSGLLLIILGYLCYRMHIVFDVCDGEVARFTKKYSLNGSYFDYMIHALLYPLFFIAMCFAQFDKWGDLRFLFIATFGSLAISLSMGVKNNYFRALLYNRRTIDEFKSKTDTTVKSGFKFKLFMLITEAMGFEGLFILYSIAFVLDVKLYFIIILTAYTGFFALKIAAKFYQLSVKGFYNTKS